MNNFEITHFMTYSTYVKFYIISEVKLIALKDFKKGMQNEWLEPSSVFDGLNLTLFLKVHKL